MVVKAIVGVRGIKTSNKRIFVGLKTSYKTFDVGSEKVGNDGILSNQAIAEWARSIQNRFKDSGTEGINAVIFAAPLCAAFSFSHSEL